MGGGVEWWGWGEGQAELIHSNSAHARRLLILHIWKEAM